MNRRLSYARAKIETLDVIDDFAPQQDVMGGYGMGGRYSARTPLSELGVDPEVRRRLYKPLNKRFAFLGAWEDLGPEDVERCVVVGDVVRLVTDRAGIVVPVGEPS